MCDLVNIGQYTASTLGIAQAGVGVVQAIGSGIAQRNINRANNQAVSANYQAQLSAVQAQQRQINAQANQQKGSIAQEAAAKRATLITAAGEAGVAGNSVVSTSQAISQSANTAMTTIETNRQGSIAQSALRAQGLRAEAQSAMRDSSFDFMGTGLQIAREGLELGTSLKRRKV